MFQRLTPMNVETTMIAFAASLLNMANGVIGKFSGIFFNLFVGVSKEDLSDYWVLKVINIVSFFYQICFIWMIPLKADLEI